MKPVDESTRPIDRNGVRYKVVSWDSRLIVGSDGTIWSCKHHGIWKKRVLSPISRNDPRPTLSIRVNGKTKTIPVQNIVLEEFVGPRPSGMEACHYPDRDVTNNNLSNLRWDTRKANFEDRDLHGTTVRGEKMHTAKLTEEAVRDIRTSKLGPTALSRKYGVHPTLLFLVRKRRIWKHVQ